MVLPSPSSAAATAVYSSKALDLLTADDSRALEEEEECFDGLPSSASGPPPVFDIPWEVTSTLGTGPYASFSTEKVGATFGTSLLEEGFQANHLNQDAAFRALIPRDQGVAVGLFGDAFSQPGTPHYEFHRSLEGFWDQFRKGGRRFGDIPTNGQYGQAVENALRAAGVPPEEVKRLSSLAAEQRLAFGLRADAKIPRVPCRFGPKKR